MGKLSRGCKDQGCFDSGLLPMESVKTIDWKYLVALLNCPVRKKLLINSN